MSSDILPRMGGIRVQRDTLIVVEDRIQQQAVHSTTIRSIKSDGMMDDSQLQQYTRPKTFRKLSNASSILTDIFRPETSEETIRRKIKRANDRDASKELIDFLRHTTPPPHNYMSFPEPSKKEQHHRHPFCWSFWKRSKKRQQKTPPGLGKLPDSAVAGRTIGGHPHIAISIPSEYAHLEGRTPLKSVQEKCESFESPPPQDTNNSVGALNVLAYTPPHELTPLQEESESQECSVDSVKDTVVMDRPQLASPAESFHTATNTNSSDPIISEAVLVRLPSIPILDKSPSPNAAELSSRGSLSGSESELPRQSTPISVGTTGSGDETPDYSSMQSRLTPIFTPLEPLASYTALRNKPSCTCRITPIMTVIDVPPTFTWPFGEKQSVIKKPTFVLPEIIITPPRAHPRQSTLHHMPRMADIRSKTSFERSVLSHRTQRSESHQELIRRYEELRINRDREIELLVKRLQHLEKTNERWLNTMIPLFEILTDRLTKTRSHRSMSSKSDVSDTTTRRNPSIPKLRRRHQLYAPQSEDSIDSFDWGKVPKARRGGPREEQIRTVSDTSSHGWDPENEAVLSKSGFGAAEVAVDRCPTRHGESLLGGDFGTMFALRVREVEEEKKKRELSGMETIEPVMRELVEDRDLRQEEKHIEEQ
ncbi:hypothetical protein QBC38DRAFT_412267 [Podospora fimiseda]|uniref:Uncharacterized protein n=1 Tax=Podospora fimiseda TaxID=252190 RepID=A0AAN7BTW6_9PEZI|nr:hypothetical protein QBC38DRAFT_412267 [Podospora fimiseda]